MNKSCETCQYIDVDAEQEPCSVCMHNYMDMYEKEDFKQLIEPLTRLKDRLYKKGIERSERTINAVLKWIKEEGE